MASLTFTLAFPPHRVQEPARRGHRATAESPGGRPAKTAAATPPRPSDRAAARTAYPPLAVRRRRRGSAARSCRGLQQQRRVLVKREHVEVALGDATAVASDGNEQWVVRIAQ